MSILFFPPLELRTAPQKEVSTHAEGQQTMRNSSPRIKDPAGAIKEKLG